MAPEKSRAEAKPEEGERAADADAVTVTSQLECIHSSLAICGPPMGHPARPSRLNAPGGEGKGGGEGPGRGARDRIGPHPLRLCQGLGLQVGCAATMMGRELAQ